MDDTDFIATKVFEIEELELRIKELENPWIKTSERLPAASQMIIAVTLQNSGRSAVECVYYDLEIKKFISFTYTSLSHLGLEKVKYWMPLPDAPKE